MCSPLNITLVIPSLASGGAERVVQVLSGELARAGHDVTVVTTTSRADHYDLDPAVRRLRTDLTGASPGRATAIRSLPRTILLAPARLRRLRRTLLATRPSVVVAFMEHANIITLALLGNQVPVIATEHSDPRHQRLGVLWQLLRRLLYPRAARLVCVSSGASEAFAWLPAAKRAVIHNPTPAEVSAPAGSTPPIRGPYIAAMGRLSQEKGFDLLLTAFASIAPRHPEWRLVIIGEGEQEASLLGLADAAGLGGRVHLTGALRDPFPELRGADLFVLSSRWEGFGNALVEAMACGVAALSFDCQSGPAEIIDSGVNGVLVAPGDTDALAEAIDRLISDPAERRRLAEAGSASVVRFRPDAIAARWESELASVARA